MSNTPIQLINRSKRKSPPPFSREHRLNIAKGHTGLKHSPETRLKNSEAHIGEKAYNWKGNNVGNKSLHQWVTRKLGKPSECENCSTITAKKYEWANISGEYKRDLSDWARLCTRCHRLFDDHSTKMWATRRLKKQKEKIA